MCLIVCTLPLPISHIYCPPLHFWNSFSELCEVLSLRAAILMLPQIKLTRNSHVMYRKLTHTQKMYGVILKVKVTQSCLALQHHELYSPRNSPGQNTRVGSCSFLQGIFPTQRLNPGLPHCKWILY